MFAEAARSPDRARQIGLSAVVVSAFGLGLSYGIGYPLTALTFKDWGAPSRLAGMAGAMPALAVFLSVTFLPRLVARIGAVPAMVAGCLVAMIGFAALPLLPFVEVWIAIRFVMGLGITLPWLVSETWINAATDDRSRGKVAALYTMALFAGFATGPVIVDALGITGWSPFLAGMAAMAMTILPLLLAARFAPPMQHDRGGGLWRAARLAPVAMVGAALAGAVEMGFVSLLPLFATAIGLVQAEALRLLTIMLIGGVVLQLAIGWLSDRTPRARLLSSLGLAAGLLTAGLALPLPVSGLYALAFLLGGMMLGLYTVSLSILGEQVPPAQLIKASAAILLTYQAGAIAGPAIAGTAMDVGTLGYVAAMAVFALLAVPLGLRVR